MIEHEQRMTTGASVAAIPDAVFLFAVRRDHTTILIFRAASLHRQKPFPAWTKKFPAIVIGKTQLDD
jgi:hypothetical protein